MEDYSKSVAKEHHYYFYLICLRTHIDSKNKLVKLGRTKNIYDHFNEYPKNSVLLYLCRVKDCLNVEAEIMNVFDEKFKRKNYPNKQKNYLNKINYLSNTNCVNKKNYINNEYFEGNVNDMIKCAMNVIDYMNQKIEEDFSLIRSEYKNYLKFKLTNKDRIDKDDYKFIFGSVDDKDENKEYKIIKRKKYNNKCIKRSHNISNRNRRQAYR